MTAPTLSYRCVVCDTAYAEIGNEQASLDPRFALGYCLECSSTQTFRVDVTSAPVQGVPLGDVVDDDTDTRPGNVYNGPGRAEKSGPTKPPDPAVHVRPGPPDGADPAWLAEYLVGRLGDAPVLSGPDPNSRDAADDLMSDGGGTSWRWRVLLVIETFGPQTTESICELTDWPWQTVSPRLAELFAYGVTERRKTKSSAGRSVWSNALRPWVSDALAFLRNSP